MKSMWLILVTTAVACALSEPCQWDQYLGNPGRTGYTYCTGVDSPEILWEITLKGEIGNPYILEDKVVVPLTVCTSGCSFGSTPSYETTIVVLDLLTGTSLQEVVCDQRLTGAYPVENNLVLGDSDRKLFEVNLLDGKASLVSTIPGRSVLASYPHPYPLILPDKIVVPTTPPVCISRTDYSTLWDLGSSLGSLYPEDAEILDIAASTDLVYVILKEKDEKKIWAVDSSTGEHIWVNNADVSEVALDGSVLFAGGSGVYALNAETGDLLWTAASGSVHSNIVAGPQAVYFTDNENLYALNKNTGELEWMSQWKGIPFWVTCIIGVGDTVICSDVLNMTAFSAKNGTELWNVHFQDHVDKSPEKICPAAADGVLVVGGDEGSNCLIALASDPELFVKQADAFLSNGITGEAINSYKTAAELYEKRGDLSTSQEILNKVQELENQPPVSASPEPTPVIPIPLVVVLIFTSILVWAAYYLIKMRRSKRSDSPD